MRTSELELLLNMIEADDEEASSKNENSLTTNEFDRSIEDTKFNTENTATEIPKSKIINTTLHKILRKKMKLIYL